jgi:hypothetical protein
MYMSLGHKTLLCLWEGQQGMTGGGFLAQLLFWKRYQLNLIAQDTSRVREVSPKSILQCPSSIGPLK